MKNLIKYHFAALFMALLFAVSFASSPSIAKEQERSKQRQEIKSNKKQQCRLISRADAISKAKRRYKGKVVGVQFSDRGKQSVYRVRMLIENKRVKTVSIKACR